MGFGGLKVLYEFKFKEAVHRLEEYNQGLESHRAVYITSYQVIELQQSPYRCLRVEVSDATPNQRREEEKTRIERLN